MTTLPVDCIVVGFAILLFAILIWGVGRMIDQRLGHMENSLVNIGPLITTELHTIECFLDRQEERDRRNRDRRAPRHPPSSPGKPEAAISMTPSMVRELRQP